MASVMDAELKEMTQEERATALGMTTEQLNGRTMLIEFDEEGDGTGAMTEPAQDFVTAGEDIINLGASRVFELLMIGRGEFVLDFVEHFQEINDGASAVGNDRVRSGADHFLQPFTGAIQDRTDLQSLGFTELFTEFEGIGGRG